MSWSFDSVRLQFIEWIPVSRSFTVSTLCLGPSDEVGDTSIGNMLRRLMIPYTNRVETWTTSHFWVRRRVSLRDTCTDCGVYMVQIRSCYKR